VSPLLFKEGVRGWLRWDSKEPLRKKVTRSTEALIPPKPKMILPVTTAAIIPEKESMRSL
jgi:hypothetical protein